MSAPFLVRFVERLVGMLEAEGDLVLVEGQRDAVVLEVAGSLGTLGEGHQLVSSLTKALLAHPGVEELYADDAQLMERISDMGPAWMRG